MSPITYPARPLNGGPLNKALPKPGQWFYEPKYNGWRALVHIPTGMMFNRLGQPLTIANEFAKALSALRSTLDAEVFKWADCEALDRRHSIGKGTLILLDVVPEPAYACAIYQDRRPWTIVVPCCAPDERPKDGSLYRTPQYTAEASMSTWTKLQGINRAWGCDFFEGLVAKRADSVYPIQLRSPKAETPLWIKHRWAW